MALLDTIPHQIFTHRHRTCFKASILVVAFLCSTIVSRGEEASPRFKSTPRYYSIPAPSHSHGSRRRPPTTTKGSRTIACTKSKSVTKSNLKARRRKRERAGLRFCDSHGTQHRGRSRESARHRSPWWLSRVGFGCGPAPPALRFAFCFDQRRDQLEQGTVNQPADKYSNCDRSQRYNTCLRGEPLADRKLSNASQVARGK